MTNKKTSLDWGYHLANLLLLVVAIWLMYAGNHLYNMTQLTTAGFWLVFVSIAAFFLKNIQYLTETSDPGNMIGMKHSPRT